MGVCLGRVQNPEELRSGYSLGSGKLLWHPRIYPTHLQKASACLGRQCGRHAVALEFLLSQLAAEMAHTRPQEPHRQREAGVGGPQVQLGLWGLILRNLGGHS